ncbi:hypothetical protein CVS30_17710, partial [Arthrobacter psychrolactophilus]
MSVADRVSALTLPVLESLEDRLAEFTHLPTRPGLITPTPENSGVVGGVGSQVEGVQLLMEECLNTVTALRRHQNHCAALLLRVVERLDTVAALEGELQGLDPWQRGRAFDQVRAELAVVLSIPEGTAEQLMIHAKSLVHSLPHTLGAMEGGELGWEFAVVIAEETELLRSIGVEDTSVESFEQTLLSKAWGSTLRSFKDKARRSRERLHPETIPERTLRAYTDRRIQKSRASDGMSWLSLYAPAPTIEAVWDHCTLTATAAQGPHEERTLTQLRADIVATLLLNQTMDENHIHRPPTT